MDGKDPSRRNLRSARAASRGSIVTSLSRETLPISGAREAELSLIAATLANRQLQIANSTSAYYAGVNKKLVETNETLENVLEEEKQSNFTVVEALDKRLEEANKEYTKLKGEVIAAQKSAQREVEKATVEMRDAWEERDHHISSLQKRIEWLEEELESVDAFREARDQHRRDMAVLQKSLENEEKNHAHDCQILRLLLMEERVRLRAEEVQLKKRHDEDVCKLARELCRQQTLEIEEENEGLKSEKIFLYHDAKEAHERISVLQQQNDELRRNAALAALAEKEHLSRAASQNREIKLLREQVKTTEENLNTVVENYEKRLQIQSKEHAAALQQLTRELDEAKNAAERFRRDLVKLRTLSQKMVERRTELEMFFYDALAQVRQEMLEERRRNTRSIGYKQNNLSSSQWGPAGLKKHESEVLLINDRDGRLTLSPFTRPGDEKMSLALQNRETPRSFGNTNPNALSLIPLTKEGEVTVTQKNRRIPAKEWNYSDSGSLTTRFPRLAEEPLCGHSDFSRIPTAPKLKDIQSIEISQLSWKDKERVLQILFKHLQGKCNTSKSKQRPSTDDSKFLMNGESLNPDMHTFLTE